MKNNVAYRQLALKLRSSILARTLKPGQKLPGEFFLAEKHKVSRTTARLAIKELEKESLVYRRQGAGTFVCSSPNSAPVTRSNFSEFIKGLSKKITRKVLDFRWLEADSELASALKIPCRSALFWFRRLDCLKQVPMAIDECWITGPCAHLLSKDDLCVLEFFEHWQSKENIKIIKSVLELAADAADSDTAKILKIKKGAPVLVELSDCFTENTGAARFKTFYRHDMYRFKRTFHHEAVV